MNNIPDYRPDYIVSTLDWRGNYDDKGFFNKISAKNAINQALADGFKVYLNKLSGHEYRLVSPETYAKELV